MWDLLQEILQQEITAQSQHSSQWPDTMWSLSKCFLIDLKLIYPYEKSSWPRALLIHLQPNKNIISFFSCSWLLVIALHIVEFSPTPQVSVIGSGRCCLTWCEALEVSTGVLFVVIRGTIQQWWTMWRQNIFPRESINVLTVTISAGQRILSTYTFIGIIREREWPGSRKKL